LLNNVKNDAAGYTSFPYGLTKDFVVESLTAILHQEELHYIGVNAALATAGQTTIAPCKYNIPVNSFESAIALANTFTDVVLSVLPLAQSAFGADGGDEAGLVQLFGSVLAQESEQNGWYRVVQGKIPAPAPFLTTSGASFAFTFLQGVIQPGCAGVELVSKSVPTYKSLKSLGTLSTADVNTKFEAGGPISETEHMVYYLSGQNAPQPANIYAVESGSQSSTFKAMFPFASAGFAKGLTVAAVVKKGKYTTAAEVAANTIYGPGIIEVD